MLSSGKLPHTKLVIVEVKSCAGAALSGTSRTRLVEQLRARGAAGGALVAVIVHDNAATESADWWADLHEEVGSDTPLFGLSVSLKRRSAEVTYGTLDALDAILSDTPR